MLNFLRNFFKKLFGGGADTDRGPQTGTYPAPAPAPETKAVEDQESETASAPAVDGFLVEIDRISPGSQDTLGKLSINEEFICFTLENPVGSAGANESTAIPAGTYSLSLKTTGGKHATYLYRFGDQHKGLIEIDEVEGFEFPHIHIGNEVSHTYGSIVVGTTAENEAQTDISRKVLYSEKAYLEVYEQISSKLLNGQVVQLKIG